MESISKVSEVSIYVGDAPYDSIDGYLESELEIFPSTAVLHKLRNKAAFLCFTIADYINQDVCRFAFLISLGAVVLSAIVYGMGNTQKTAMQNYLIQLEGELENKRDVDMLVRNTSGLAILLQTKQLTDTVDKREKVQEYFSNIKSYFNIHAFSVLENFFKGKIETIENGVVNEYVGTPISRTTADVPAHEFEMQSHNSYYYVNLLKDYAADQNTLIGKRIAILEKDSRKVMVGNAPTYNLLMDWSFSLGLLFLILAIASIPGLGKHVKTGFV